MLNRKLFAMALLPLMSIATIVVADVTKSQISIPTPGLAMIKQAKLLGPVQPEKKIHFTVWVKLRNKAQLDQKLASIYDASSAEYQKFLTHEEYVNLYAPDAETLDNIQQYFMTRGMQAYIDTNHNVQVNASAAQIEQLFQVQMHQYQFNGKLYYANTTAPILDSQIAQSITSITGLNNLPYFHPFVRKVNERPKPHNAATQLNLLWDSFFPEAQPTLTSLNGLTGANLQTAYQIATIPKIKHQSVDGKDQTIVIVDFCGKGTVAQITANANIYNKSNHIKLLNSTNFKITTPNGKPYALNSSCGITGWEEEISLDVQAAHTFAPNANIVLVQATVDLENAETTVISTITASPSHSFAGFANAHVITNSWGGQELNSAQIENALTAAAVQGLSVNFSSGDCGDNIGSIYCQPYPGPGKLSVNYPASSPVATAIGGTSLFVSNTWDYAFESGWGNFVGKNFKFGSGGGISQVFTLPTWQKNIRNFMAGGYTDGNIGHYNKRALPDISLLADPYTGLKIYSTTGNGCNGFCQLGGTSLACPLFSATLTLVNQARALFAGGIQKPIGFVAPYLYNNQNKLDHAHVFRVISPPHQIINGAKPVANGPTSAFIINGITFNWDSSLAIIENQFWDDVAGMGSPNIPYFVSVMAEI
jgi:subtilase family serine protease